jgi:hypothetical protein
MFGFLGSSTESEADQEVSPLSELAVHVYKAVSWGVRSGEGKNTRFRESVFGVTFFSELVRRSSKVVSFI